MHKRFILLAILSISKGNQHVYPLWRSGSTAKDSRLSDLKLTSRYAKKQELTCDSSKSSYQLPFCLPSNYEKHIKPGGDGQTEILSEITVKEVEKIMDAKMKIQFHFEIVLSWRDERIHLAGKGINDSHGKYLQNRNDAEDKEEENYLQILDENLLDEQIWMPDVTFVNLEEFRQEHMITRLANLRVYPNKTFEYTFEAKVVVGCHFHFERYPFDRQECKILMGSFAYPLHQMAFRGDTKVEEGLQRPLRHEVKILELEESDRIFQWQESDDSERFHSVTGFRIVLERISRGYLTTSFLPAAMPVLLSFIGFLVGNEEVAARMAVMMVLIFVEIKIL